MGPKSKRTDILKPPLSKIKTFLQLNLFLTVFLIAISAGNAQPLFEVEQESFCKEVQGHRPINSFSGVAEIKKREGIFLWMQIRGGQRALTMLQSKGQMPIYHAWGSESGICEILNMGITKENWTEHADAIKNQVKKRGVFSWRTQSFKRNLKEGNWYVSVLDANKKPIPKFGSGTEPCRPEIVIRVIEK